MPRALSAAHSAARLVHPEFDFHLVHDAST